MIRSRTNPRPASLNPSQDPGLLSLLFLQIARKVIPLLLAKPASTNYPVPLSKTFDNYTFYSNKYFMNNCSPAPIPRRVISQINLRIGSQPEHISHFPEEKLCFALCVLFWSATFPEFFQGHVWTKTSWESSTSQGGCLGPSSVNSQSRASGWA